MLTSQELMRSAMDDRMRFAAELRRQQEAERAMGAAAASPRSSRARKIARRVPLVHFVTRLRTASVP